MDLGAGPPRRRRGSARRAGAGGARGASSGPAPTFCWLPPLRVASRRRRTRPRCRSRPRRPPRRPRTVASLRRLQAAAGPAPESQVGDAQVLRQRLAGKVARLRCSGTRATSALIARAGDRRSSDLAVEADLAGPVGTGAEQRLDQRSNVPIRAGRRCPTISPDRTVKRRRAPRRPTGPTPPGGSDPAVARSCVAAADPAGPVMRRTTSSAARPRRRGRWRRAFRRAITVAMSAARPTSSSRCVTSTTAVAVGRRCDGGRRAGPRPRGWAGAAVGSSRT